MCKNLLQVIETYTLILSTDIFVLLFKDRWIRVGDYLNRI